MRCLAIVLVLISACYVDTPVGETRGIQQEAINIPDGRYYFGDKATGGGGTHLVRGEQRENYWLEDADTDILVMSEFKDGELINLNIKIAGKCYEVDTNGSGVTKLTDVDYVKWRSEESYEEGDVTYSFSLLQNDGYPLPPASIQVKATREGEFTARKTGDKVNKAIYIAVGRLLPTSISKRSFHKQFNHDGDKIHPKEVREQFNMGDICGSRSGGDQAAGNGSNH